MAGIRSIGIAATLTAATLMSACESLKPEPCAGDNWLEIGRADGAAGAGSERFASRAKACQREGRPADEAAWRQGWQRGLPSYCTLATGEAQGAQGAEAAKVCEGRAAYVDGWQLGMNRFCTREQGLSAGSQGGAFRQACNGRNADAYANGYRAGLVGHCTGEMGYQLGVRGKSYNGVCRGQNEDAVLRGVRIGETAKRTQDQIDEVGRRVRSLESDLKNTKDDKQIAALQERLRAADRERRQLRDQLTNLQLSR